LPGDLSFWVVNKIVCPVCNVQEAIKDAQLGVLPCTICRDRQRFIKNPGHQIEFTSQEIREGRRKYGKSILQKYREGELSKEFIEAYPERAKAMVDKGIHTQEEIKRAKPVWKDIEPAGGWGRTK